jgi:hypothetical protein
VYEVVKHLRFMSAGNRQLTRARRALFRHRDTARESERRPDGASSVLHAFTKGKVRGVLHFGPITPAAGLPVSPTRLRPNGQG